MNCLTPEAAERYYELSAKAYNRGLISLTPMLVRLHALRSMCAPDDPICKVLQSILQPHDFTIDDEWRDGGEIYDEVPKEQISDVRGENEESVVEPRKDSSGNLTMHLVPAASTGLSKWEFRQADPDFFPSIPHGASEIGCLPWMDLQGGKADGKRTEKKHHCSLER